MKIRIYKNVASFWGGFAPQTPFISRITDLHLLQMLAFHLSLGLFTIILVNNVTFCQTKRYKIYNDVNPCLRDIIIVVEVKAFGTHSLYQDFRVFDSLMIRSVPLPFTIGTS